MAKTSQRYRVVKGKYIIEVRVRSVMQLFDARDPAPFRERDLDDDFAEYILSSSEEIAASADRKILIHVTESSENPGEEKEIMTAIRAHFAYQAELKQMQLKKLFRTGQLFLVIGLVGLFACLGLANFVAASASSESETLRVLKEGLIILGWVAMWKPFELVLYDWWPLYDRIKLLKRMVNTEVDVVYGSK